MRWRTLPEFPMYRVSDRGDIFSEHLGGVMVASLHRSGHLNIALHSASGGRKTLQVHRLVLLAFVGEPSPGQIACHNDGDPSNNHVENLRWGTPSSNAWDSIRHGTHIHARKTHCKRGHPFTAINTYVTKKGWRRCRECRHLREGRPSVLAGHRTQSEVAS